MPLRKEPVPRTWYVRVEGEGGICRRKLLRILPPLWEKKIELSPAWASVYGAVRDEKATERALERLTRETY